MLTSETLRAVSVGHNHCIGLTISAPHDTFLLDSLFIWEKRCHPDPVSLPCNVFMNYNSILNKNLITWNENKLSLIWIRLFWFGCIVFWIFYFDQRNLTKVVVLCSLEILIDCALSCCNNTWILMNCDIPLKCFNSAFLTMYYVFYLMFQNLLCIVVCLSSTGFQESLNWIEL